MNINNYRYTRGFMANYNKNSFNSNSYNKSYKNNQIYKKDSVSISNKAKDMLKNSRDIIQGTKELRAESNILTFNYGEFYSFNHNGGNYTVGLSQKGGFIGDPNCHNFENDDPFFNCEKYAKTSDIERLERFLNLLKSGCTSLTFEWCGYSNSDVKSIFEDLGVKAGKVEIKTNGKSCSVWTDGKGEVYSNEQVDGYKKIINQTNWLKLGCHEGSTFKISGKEYQVDSTGHLNIPENVLTTYSLTEYPEEVLPAWNYKHEGENS